MVEINYGPLPPKPTSWVEVFAITGSLHGVPIEDIEQGRVDWEYEFSSSDMRHCGREGCKQIHGHGWIVALRDGRYVHVGKDCARKYANLEIWDVQIKAYNERIAKDIQCKALIEARSKAQFFFDWLDNNLELPVASALYVSFVNEAQGPLFDDLHKRADKGEPEVRKETRLSEEEITRRKDAMSQVRADGTTYTPHVPSTEFIQIGVLRGIHCFKHDIARLKQSLERNALHLLRVSHGEMTKSERENLRTVISDMEDAKRKLDRAISDVWLFFTDDNLKLVVKTDAARKQGIIGIGVQSGQVVFTRRPHWNKRAA